MSDSSDDDDDAFFEDCLEEKEFEDCSNVGLQVESFKCSRGEKGRLITTQLNPRAVNKDPFMSLSVKLNKVGTDN